MQTAAGAYLPCQILTAFVETRSVQRTHCCKASHSGVGKNEFETPRHGWQKGKDKQGY